jgi:hypothetical protein
MPTVKRGLAGVFKIMENRQKRREQWRADARTLWEEWRGDPFFVLGVGLYWGEGSKSPNRPRLQMTNADVHLLRVWLRWCQRFLPGVPLYTVLHVHDRRQLDPARAFWKKQLGININAACVSVSSASKRKRNSLPNGTLNVRVARGSVEWYTKMMVWLELAQQM